MKSTLLVLIAASFSFAQAKPNSVSAAAAKRLDGALKAVIGDGLSGKTPKGEACTVTYASEDVEYRHKPTGETYMSLMIVAPKAAYQDCGVAGINFLLGKSELEGRGDISLVKIGKSEIEAGAQSTFTSGERGAETYGRHVQIELANGKAKSVEMSVVGTCTCIIGK